jgi:hypothetical protein
VGERGISLTWSLPDPSPASDRLSGTPVRVWGASCSGRDMVVVQGPAVAAQVMARALDGGRWMAGEAVQLGRCL